MNDTTDPKQAASGEPKANFKIKKVTKFSDLSANSVESIPTSDLLLSDSEAIYQFEYVEPDDNVPQITAKPGVFTLGKSMSGLTLLKTDVSLPPVLEGIDNANFIKHQLTRFHSRLHVYETLGQPKKRNILLYGPPGTGKTVSIQKAFTDKLTEDPGTVVLVWPTSSIRSDDVEQFFKFGLSYTKECTNLILVIEDIGGTEVEGHGGPRGVDSALLSLLDGIGVTFSLPTFIIATTNFPQSLIGPIANRPGRFDELIELPAPSGEDRIRLTEFIAKRELTDEEKDSLRSNGAKQFSIAHLKELVIRSMLMDKSIKQVTEELIAHREKFESGFDRPKKMGFGREDWD